MTKTKSENLDYRLKEGPLTIITPQIKKLSKSLQEEGIDSLFGFTRLIETSLKKRKPSWKLLEKYHQKRSADKLIKDGWGISCSDAAILFCALARAKGVPTEYVQTVNIRSYLNKPKSPNGHTFCICYLNGRKYIVDPVRGFIWKLEGNFKYISLGQENKYVRAFSGLDNAACGITNHNELILALQNTAKIWFEKLKPTLISPAEIRG